MRRRRGGLLRGAGGEACPSWPRAALAASGPDTVVTDVGSTKREIVAALGDDERFIGGHPLAGAETAGVDNARADLFEGARWYLTPTERSSGVLYDRLQRTIAGLGARPQAIDAEAHDRLMATVSHLPHVLANVLAGQAAAELTHDSERMPEVGPSFRDATRVAGSNPAIWGDIFAANREAVAAAIDDVIARLREARELIGSGEPDAVAAWHAAAGADRRRLLETELEGGPLHELRVVVANRPGTVAELALALGEAGVNIEDMALHPAPDMKSGAISLWVAGDEQAERAASLVRDLGHSATVLAEGVAAVATRFDPSGPLRGSLRPPPDKSISHRAALIAAMGEGETTIEGYLDAADTRSTLSAVRSLGAEVEIGSAEAGDSGGFREDRDGPGMPVEVCSVSGEWACAGHVRPRSTPATPGAAHRRRQRGHAAAPAAGLARGAAETGPGRSTATTRSAAARSTGSPSRCA